MTNPLKDLIQADLMSQAARTILLSRIPSLLTVCARGTYEVGNDNVIKPQLLRAYSELLHRVTGAYGITCLNPRTVCRWRRY
jgi:hypothetical protein